MFWNKISCVEIWTIFIILWHLSYFASFSLLFIRRHRFSHSDLPISALPLYWMQSESVLDFKDQDFWFRLVFILISNFFYFYIKMLRGSKLANKMREILLMTGWFSPLYLVCVGSHQKNRKKSWQQLWTISKNGEIPPPPISQQI